MTVMSKPLVLTEQQKESINFLKKELRNTFEHYIPMTWGIVIDGLHQILTDIFDIIQFLALDTGNYVMLDREQRRKIKFYIESSKHILQNHNKNMADIV